MPTIFTIGHSNHPIGDFLAMLTARQIRLVADVRKIPRSGHNPQYNNDSLPASLQTVQIGYLHFPGLGGRRSPQPDSVNGGWRNDSFRAYADYMQTPEFAASLAGLIEQAAMQPTAILCAEAVPWRCHRSLIADALIVRGWTVFDIMSRTQVQLHKLTPFAHIDGTRITYPPEQPNLL